MRTLHAAALILVLTLALVCCQKKAELTPQQPIALVIHGGAGTILKKNMTAERDAAYRQKLEEALDARYSVLKNGGSSLDAVQVTIIILEDSPLFNAGKGAVFTNAGSNELDASIMDGKTLNAGAVAGVKTIKNPILAARLVMEKTPHVLLGGDGADKFAANNGLEIVSNDYFYTERRWKQIQKRLEKDSAQTNEVHPGGANHKYGTVGCVALDRQGNLAAGTSTGGMTNKRWGRIGDSPIIGAGNYANNETCAVSGTGTGEIFIRSVAAYEVSVLMEYQGLSLEEASNQVVHNKLVELGGEGSGGLIAIDAQGNISAPFNTEGMYRAWIDKQGKKEIRIYGNP